MPSEHEQDVQLQIAGLHAAERCRPCAARARQARSASRRGSRGRRSAGTRVRRSSPAAGRCRRSYSSSTKYLPESSRCSAAKRCAARPRARAVAAEEERRAGEPDQRQRDRADDDAASRGARSSGRTSGSGSSGSRKCGTATKPPTADSTASTTSMPVIDGGDSCTWCSVFGVHARRAEEREPQQPEHVEGGQQRRARRDGEEQRRAAAAAGEREPEDLVLGEESRERRNAGDGGRGDGERGERDRDLAREPAHLADVLLAAQARGSRCPPPRNRQALKNACV